MDLNSLDTGLLSIKTKTTSNIAHKSIKKDKTFYHEWILLFQFYAAFCINFNESQSGDFQSFQLIFFAFATFC